MTVVLRVGLVVLVPLFVVWLLLSPPVTSAAVAAHASAGAAGTVKTRPILDGDSTDDTGREVEDEAVPDLYGNPVTDAVAKYKFDATGSLYELHSPQTELPKLGAPKS